MNAKTRLALITRLAQHPLLDGALWFGHAPDEAAPPVVLLTLGQDKRLLSHSGPVGLAEASLSVDVWAADDEAAIALRQAAVEQLHGYAGAVEVLGSSGKKETATITHCVHEGSNEDYDAQSNLAHASAAFSLGYKTR